ncbi:MAG: hypothetical protein C4519_28225 [Desulfobacteraceae bacterium]|nr:MAG: hypothetical protein C4519_28225 [Desulfobacteraceae bacterium]
MKSCRHTNLVLLPETSLRLRCRHCHLTLKAEELEGGYCPECFETERVKRVDFEKLESSAATRYQCEACGAIIEYSVHSADGNLK